MLIQILMDTRILGKIFSNPAELTKKNITLDENIKFQNDYNRIKK